jgi:magnesium chelatase family protein
VQRYRSKLSGPLLDRIDLQVDVPAVPVELIVGKVPPAETSHDVRERVNRARNMQLARSGNTNSRIASHRLEAVCAVSSSATEYLRHVMDQLGLSARSYHRVIKVARTIADLSGEDGVSDRHIAEAVRYRSIFQSGSL